jgi:hypothetical protein
MMDAMDVFPPCRTGRRSTVDWEARNINNTLTLSYVDDLHRAGEHFCNAISAIILK